MIKCIFTINYTHQQLQKDGRKELVDTIAVVVNAVLLTLMLFTLSESIVSEPEQGVESL